MNNINKFPGEKIEVLKMGDWATILNLKSKASNPSNREIARLLGISHNTVKRALESETGPKYERAIKVNPDIDVFASYIEDGILAKGLCKSRILNDIISKGYKGSKSAFYRYCENIKPSVRRVFQSYETAPGEQAQFDWAHYTIVIAGALTKVYVFSYILGYSRYRIYKASLSQSASSTYDALESSIIETSGVSDRIQTDNAACFVTNASKNNFQWNKRYLQFCGHYRINPTRSLPGHPWSKGKVERPFNYLEEHFIKGNTFESFEDFIKRLSNFQDEVNQKVHSTTKQTPLAMFEQEKLSLKPLPINRFVDIKEEVRKVSHDCIIRYNSNIYSVPYIFATKEVWLKVSQGYKLQIYSSSNKFICEHNLAIGKGNLIINEEHYKNHRAERGNWEISSQIFIKSFPEKSWFLDKIKAQKRINPSYHLSRILELIKYYRKEDMETAMHACQEYNVYTNVFLRAYLENHCKIEEIIPIPIESNILKKYENPDIKRSLAEYKISINN